MPRPDRARAELAAIRRAAPVARWTLGKPAAYVVDYYRRKGATVERIA